MRNRLSDVRLKLRSYLPLPALSLSLSLVRSRLVPSRRGESEPTSLLRPRSINLREIDRGLVTNRLASVDDPCQSISILLPGKKTKEQFCGNHLTYFYKAIFTNSCLRFLSKTSLFVAIIFVCYNFHLQMTFSKLKVDFICYFRVCVCVFIRRYPQL